MDIKYVDVKLLVNNEKFLFSCLFVFIIYKIFMQ